MDGPRLDTQAATPAAPDTETRADALEKSYGAAAATLALELEELRDERDQALRCLQELSAPIDAAQELLSGKSPEHVLEQLLKRVSDGLGASSGELALYRPDGSVERAVLYKLAVDPFPSEPDVKRSLVERDGPVIFTISDPGPLQNVIDRVGSDCGAAVAIPVRSPIRSLGLLCMFMPLEAPLPTERTMSHLSRLGQSLALALELASGTVPAPIHQPQQNLGHGDAQIATSA